MKITKSNWKTFVKDLKDKNKMIYTVTGKRIPAKKAKFELTTSTKGNYEIIAKWK